VRALFLELRGVIATHPVSARGFGYYSIFFVPEFGQWNL
jgi:inosine/xanthosine triphosphate pyrophosphatase family protein